MNAEPHTHKVKVTDHGYFWGINYGDQQAIPDKPSHCWAVARPFFALFAGGWTDEQVLRHNIRKIIREHDRASVRAGESVTMIERVMSDMQPPLEPEPAIHRWDWAAMDWAAIRRPGD